MKNFRYIDPQRLEIREGGGCLSLFGLPFFCAGVFLFFVSIGVVPLQNADEVPSWSYLVMLFMSLAFTAVGAGLVFGRSWKVIDLNQGRVIKTMGLLVPMKREECFLENYNAVLLRLEPGDSDSPDRFPVVLKHVNDQGDLPLYTADNYGDGRKYSEELAQFIQLPLEDTTTDHKTVIAAGKIKDPRPMGIEATERFEQPWGLKSRVEQADGVTKIQVPGSGFNPVMFLPVALPLGLMLFIGPAVLEFFEKTGTPKAVQSVFGGFAVFMFLGIPLLGLLYNYIGSKRSGTTVLLKDREVLIEERAGWSTARVRISAGDVVGLDYSVKAVMLDSMKSNARFKSAGGTSRDPELFYQRYSGSWWFKALEKMARAKGVILKTRKGLHSFGLGLPDDEIKYLYGVVKDALAAMGVAS